MLRIGRIKAVFATGLIALLLSGAPAPASAFTTSNFVGAWWGALDWDGTDYDGDGSSWMFYGNGTFVDNSNQTGHWNATSSGITLQYDNGARSQYTGNLVGNVVLGTMTNGEIHGQFMLVRGQRPY